MASIIAVLLCALLHTASCGRLSLPKDKILKQVAAQNVDKGLCTDIIKQAETAYSSFGVEASHFLSPLEFNSLKNALGEFVDIRVCGVGGYAGAERQRLLIARNEGEDEYAFNPLSAEAIGSGDVYVSALRVSGNFLLESISQQDVTESLVGNLGLSKGDIGDVIIQGDRGFDGVFTSDIAPTVYQKLKQIRNVPVLVEDISLSDLKVKAIASKEITSVEASMRLDAVASAGFGISRSNMVKRVENGAVSVDFREVRNGAQTLQAGQVVSISGMGKVEIKEVSQTSKGRYRVKMSRSA
jgi:photosystem II S4 domain protein